MSTKLNFKPILALFSGVLFSSSISNAQSSCTTPSVLDWSNVTWIAGATSNSYTVNTTTLSFSLTDPSGALLSSSSSSSFFASPYNVAFYSGDGSTTPQKALSIAGEATIMGTANKITTTITFSKLVKDVSFKLFDVDGATSPKRSEVITVSGSNGTTTITPTLTKQVATSDQTISGGTVTSGTTAYANVGTGSDNGTINVAFSSPVDKVTIEFSLTNTNTSTGFSANTEPGFALHDINFCDDVIVLPVNFGIINATVSNEILSVNWETLSEKNNNHFEVEVSTDGKTFSHAATVVSKVNGETEQNQTYAVSISLHTNVHMGIGVAAIVLIILLLFGIKMRNKFVLTFSTIVLVGTIGFASCQKNSIGEIGIKYKKLYVRIVQIDNDGTKTCSKIIQAQNKD
ncbi:MAG: hypothetical protein ACK5NK_14790 [Niabella sp.]